MTDNSMYSLASGPSNKTTKGLLAPGTIMNLYNRPQTAPPAGPSGIQRPAISLAGTDALGPLPAIPGKSYGDYPGARSTTYSKTFTAEDDPRLAKFLDKYGKSAAVVVPTVVNGKFLTDDEAVDQLLRTGQHLGVFDSWQSAEDPSTAIHNSQAVMGSYYGAMSKLLPNSMFALSK